MNKDVLTKIGLSEQETSVYNFLLEEGETTAGLIIKKTKIKRGTVYNILKYFLKNSLITQSDKTGVAKFKPEHPLKLKEYFDKKLAEVSYAKSILENNLPDIVSKFNLSQNKPGIQYFEGMSGTQIILNDSLTSKTEILTYADLEAIQKYIPEINREYVEKRDKLNIKKRGIVLDTPFSRKFIKDYHPNVTETKLILPGQYPFNTIVQIYDQKVSYLTLSEKNIVGIIIHDKNIYQTHKLLFKRLWESLS